MERKLCQVEMLAMEIVNSTNEINGVPVETRQKNNDECFNIAIRKISRFLYNDVFEEGL